MISFRIRRTSWVEKMPYYKRIEPELELELEQKMKELGCSGRGSCRTYWALKKQLLREKYKIRFWKSPAELNPHIRYD
jgi:hypothetical protein